MAKLRKPNRLLAQLIPRVWYIGFAARGSTAPKIERLIEVADMAEAA